MESIKHMASRDERMRYILNNYEDYPQDLQKMLSKNMDMLDFVYEYPTKKGNVYADTVGNVTKGTFPLLLQWDQRWGYANYGNSSIAVSGCGPTCLSMVNSGLTGKNTITPYTVAKFAEDNGYFIEGSGTSWDLMTKGASHFGIVGKPLSLYKANFFSTLEKGYPIICSMLPGDFTSVGHFIVLTGIEDGKIRVNDPNSKQRSNQLWSYERIAKQINNCWYYTVK